MFRHNKYVVTLSLAKVPRSESYHFSFFISLQQMYFQCRGPDYSYVTRLIYWAISGRTW